MTMLISYMRGYKLLENRIKKYFSGINIYFYCFLFGNMKFMIIFAKK